MIQLSEVTLPETTQEALDGWQLKIDAIDDYAERVEAAKEQFSNRNRQANPVFRVIREKLTEMCSGARRCGYCEDSYADEVEHIKPKDLYPEFVFVWNNYLYACGPCNGPKNNRFAIFASVTGGVIDVTRRRGEPVVPPEPGDPLLIDPRREDPLAFMMLDLRDTFWFMPIAEADSREYRRAEYTIDVLRLNDRDALLAAREEAYRSYRARFSEYLTQRDADAPEDTLRDLIAALHRMGHPTVWKEMQRQHRLIPDLHDLFERAPEALDW